LYLAINWINTSGAIKWVYPVEPNSEVINRSIVYLADESFNEAFEYARNTKLVGLSPVIPFFQGGFGIASYIPIVYNNTLTGFFNVVFEIVPIFEDEINQTPNIGDYQFEIYAGDTLFYQYQNEFNINNKFVIHKNINYYYRQLDFYFSPTPDTLNDNYYFYEIDFILLAIFISLMTFLMSNLIVKKNKLLQKEYEEKEEVKKLIFQNKKLESLGTLSGSISHEFNNFLQSIQGNVFLLQELVLAKLKEDNGSNKDIIEEFEDNLAMIDNVVQRATDLTTQILTFSRHAETHLTPILITKPIMDSVNMMKEMTDRRITITVVNKLTKPSYVLANDTRLVQVLLNILINSRDAIENDLGKIWVTTKCKPFSLDKQEIEKLVVQYPSVEINYQECLEIKIKDNGIGMKDEQLEKAFDPFYSSKSLKGTGLGLSISHQLILSFKGEISLESTYLAGTIVTITLPLLSSSDIEEKIESKVPSVVPKDLPDLSGRNILLVDDEIGIRSSLTKYLKSMDAELDSFENGQAALDHFLINPEKYSLIITDINQPGLNGIDLYNKMLEVNQNINVLFITGFAEKTIPDLDKPNIDVLVKPFNLKDFVIKIYNLINV
jgi:signal transduction histidine kinase